MKIEAYDGPILRLVRSIPYEGLVDRERRDRKELEIAQRRVTGAEIIDGDVKAQVCDRSADRRLVGALSPPQAVAIQLGPVLGDIGVAHQRSRERDLENIDESEGNGGLRRKCRYIGEQFGGQSGQGEPRPLTRRA